MPGSRNTSGFRGITVAELETMLQRGGLRLIDMRARQNGFADVYNLQGGITAWAHAGSPIAA